MKNERTFRNLLAALEVRAEHVSVASQLGLDRNHAYEYGYLQGMLYHLATEVPGVEEWLEKELELMSNLNRIEGITSELAVPEESL